MGYGLIIYISNYNSDMVKVFTEVHLIGVLQIVVASLVESGFSGLLDGWEGTVTRPWSQLLVGKSNRLTI